MRFSTAFLLISLLAFVLIFSSLLVTPHAQAEPLSQEGATPTLSGIKGDTFLGEIPRLNNYTIYFTEASGEASRFDRSDFGISRLAGLLQILGAELLTLNWNQEVPDDADLILVAGPLDDLSADQSARLWSYIIRGGRLLLLADPLTGEFNISNNTLTVSPTDALNSDDAFFQLTWADLGIRARDEIIVIGGEPEMIRPFPDQPQQDQPTPTPLPMVETIPLTWNLLSTDFNTTHPITAGLQGELAFFGARPLEFDSSIQVFDTLVLVRSGADTYGESDFGTYIQRGVAQYNVGEDLAQGSQALVAVVEAVRAGTRVVLIGDRDFITNGGGFQTSPPSTAGFIHPDNVRFTLNSIVWLLEAESDDRVEFSFPTPGPTTTMTPTPTVTHYLSPTPSFTPTLATPIATEGS